MNFEYAKVTANHYVSLRLNPIYYLWLLITKRKILPAVFGKRIIAKLLKARYSPPKEMNLLRIPVDGTWCKRVRGGFKVFDVKRRIVTKVYKPGTNKHLIQKQIELFTRVGLLEFAPDLKGWNIDEGWYGEEFVEGLSGHELVLKDYPKTTMDRYFSIIEPIIERLIFTDSPVSQCAFDYLEKVNNSFSIAFNKTENIYDAELLQFVKDMTLNCKEHIGGKKIEIFLVFSHGDFHQFNMFRNGRSLKLIDWEGSQRLSLLFDFYNFFFSQLYLDNTTLDCPSFIEQGISKLSQNIALKNVDLSRNLVENSDLYRFIYYIERIHTFLTTFKLNNLEIKKWTDSFKKFEKFGDSMK